MKRAYFSIPGLFIFIIICVIYIAIFPALEDLINIALPSADGYTQLTIILIPAVILIGLLVGYYNSVKAPDRGYGGYQ